MTPRVWRALVVDDNAINLEVTVKLLQQWGLQTDEATGGEQAVARTQAVAYDLIVMDVQMPGMDGIEATRRIRRAGGRLLPIMALTANADADDRNACLNAGMNDYLIKPVVPDTLRLALQRWLPGWAAAAPQGGNGAVPQSGNVAVPQGRNAAVQHEGLAAIEGFDLAGSLQNLGGQMPRLERVLLRFADTYRAGEPALLEAARLNDHAALWQLCHSLRGACAVLCATRLVQRIEALEAALENSQQTAGGSTGLQDTVQPLQAELVELAGQLAAVLDRH